MAIDHLKQTGKICVKDKRGFRFIRIRDILYIERRQRKTIVIRDDKEEFISSASLKELENKLMPYEFFRSHQSYLIPIRKIETDYASEYGRSYVVELEGTNQKIPVSKRKHYDLKRKLQTIFGNEG